MSDVNSQMKKEKDAEALLSRLSLIASLFVLFILAGICIFCAYSSSKNYTVEVIAHIDSYEYYDKDDYLIGYTSRGIRVYSNVNYVRTPYKYTYVYEYDNSQFSYEVWSSTERTEPIRLYINPDKPSEAIHASSKVNWKEFCNWFK